MGFVAPGAPNYATLYEQLLERPNGEEAPQPVSRWQRFKQRTVTLFPFIWPKSSIRLQVHIIICLSILVIARVVNLYVPIFYKNVGRLPLSSLELPLSRRYLNNYYYFPFSEQPDTKRN